MFIVPEAATLLFHNGARFHDFLVHGEEGVVNFQTQLAHLQMYLERIMQAMATSSRSKVRDNAWVLWLDACMMMQAVMLCDRGVIDGKAYCSAQEWALVLDQLGLSEENVRDRRYDAVVHLVTAANGAEKYYTLAQVVITCEEWNS